ncbi:MAG: OadG family protein [Clostridiales bacterium]|nr:OadG family protein [Clostridiales bacterium]
MDNVIFSLSTTLIGLLVVFAGLVILIVCLSCMNKLMNAKKEKAAKEAAPAAVAEAPVQEEEIAEVDDGAIIAAITAAIACIWQENQEQSGFVVRRVRRVQSSTARARAARDEQIFSRL